MENELTRAAEWIAAARKTVALTGAGVSTESGIPDFRSDSGLWVRFNPMEYATLDAFVRDPEKVWKMFLELHSLLEARPNPGHRALAELEAEGALKGIITQNIDGLHQAAGSQNVIEYHGTHRTLTCLKCGTKYSRDQAGRMGTPPRCTRRQGLRTCKAILKPDVVLFGEMIPEEAMTGSRRLLLDADLLLVIGTSCEVYPASSFPEQVHDQGGKVIELNLEPSDAVESDLVLQGSFSDLMPRLVKRWREVR